jgi:hypothetical protein
VEYEKKGINVAALSYDSVEIVRTFSDRVGIGFPLLADPDYRIIDSFGIVNTSVPADSPYFGFAYAGYYLIDVDGVVTAKFFNDLNADRTTSASILVREFDGEGDGRQGEAKTPHLTLNWSASNLTLHPGERGALVIEVELESGMHLYAPGDHQYLAVDWQMKEVGGAEFLEPVFPAAETKHLPAIQETVPVYQGAMRVLRDVHILGGREFPEELQGREQLEIIGEFKYQACDADRCYFPESIPLKWNFNLQDHDLTRVPESIRRDAGGN